MRSGTWRGVAFAFALISAISTGSARADLFHHTIPREVDAVDVNTGGPYYAPPIPYGCYAKDNPLAGPLGSLYNGIGMLKGLVGGCHTCGACNGNGCDSCGGTGTACGRGRGCGLFHHGDGCGDPCRACGGGGCGFCKGLGLLREGCGHPRGPAGSGGPGEGNVGGGSLISPQVPAPIPSLQRSPPSTVIAGQCGDPGCLLKNRHFHRIGRGCSACNGKGCGICRDPGKSCGTICGNCRGRGCGPCGGRGLLPRLNPGAAASSLLARLFHRGEIEYFVGPGGPVPLTPGYVPYIVTTRAPRDFFAFPPFSDLDP